MPKIGLNALKLENMDEELSSVRDAVSYCKWVMDYPAASDRVLKAFWKI